MNIYYGIYPADNYICDFITTAYQVESILCLTTKPEISWYTRNMSELQSPNRTIWFTGPTRRLVTHQTTSWTEQLYKNTHTQGPHNNYTILHHPLLSHIISSLIQWKYVPFASNLMLDIIYTLLGIAYTYMPTAPTKIYNRHETSQILTYQPHSNIWGHPFLMLPTPTASVLTHLGL